MTNLLELLDGEWAGTGAGEYPTIEPFEYQESLCFTLDETRPIIHYEQKTRRRNDEQSVFKPSHWETGFIELLPDNQVQVANAQSGGRVEVMAGVVEPAANGLILRLQSTHFANDSRMEKAMRTITVDGDILHYTMHMQTAAVPHLAIHLEATLHRK
jgi:hypothetical protein